MKRLGLWLTALGTVVLGSSGYLLWFTNSKIKELSIAGKALVLARRYLLYEGIGLLVGLLLVIIGIVLLANTSKDAKSDIYVD